MVLMARDYTRSTMQVLQAADGSKNFIWDRGLGQALEARYVVRDEGELICYLSSQTACGRACRMCHLTRTGQVNPTDANLDDFLRQATTVLDEAQKGQFWTVSYNFMARGEPMDNAWVEGELLQELAKLAMDRQMVPRFKISTIMPDGINLDLVKRFPVIHPDIYYSFYSARPAFRKKWFPKAAEPELAFHALKEWQDFSHKIPRIHLALIKGENDSEQHLSDIVTEIQYHGLRVDFNIVRYNPYDSLSEEGDWRRARNIFTDMMPQSKVQVIQRVGLEAKASCGMFVS